MRASHMVMIAALVVGCSGPAAQTPSAGAGPGAEPAPQPAPQPTVDLSGSWSDRDTDQATAALARDFVAGGWLGPRGTDGAAPRVAVGNLINRSAEHINYIRFGERMRAALKQAGKVTVADKAPLELQLAMVTGGDLAGDTELKDYMVVATLTDRNSGEQLWVGTFRRRKLVKRVSRGEDRPPRTTVRLLGADDVVDLSGMLTGHDLATLGAQAGADLLVRLRTIEPPPVLKIRPIANRTSMHVNRIYIIASLRAAIVGKGKARVVSGSGTGLAPTHIVSGALTSASEKVGAEMVSMYQLSLDAVAVDSDAKVWVFTRRVKKVTPAPAPSQ